MNDAGTKKSRAASIYRWSIIPNTILVNIVAWMIPSNTVYLVAQNRDVLLGRYSVERLTFLLFMLPISVATAYLLRANKANRKMRHFKVAAVTLSVVFPVLAVDLLARLREPKLYLHAPTHVSRQPNMFSRAVIRDVPEQAFAYPTDAQGYPDIQYTFTTDARGFRNTTDAAGCEIVTLGDSFTEGDRVSDEHPWPVVLAKRSNLKVYNLGVSSAHPGTYIETLRQFAVDLDPNIVICMFYEGNDFWDSNAEGRDRLGRRIERYVKYSPIRLRFKALMVRHLSLSSDTSIPPEDRAGQASTADALKPEPSPAPQEVPSALSWLPARVPDSPQGRYYTFTVKQLAQHLAPAEQLSRSNGWKYASAKLLAIKTLCDQKGLRLILAYAPDKARILLPLLTDTVSPQQLHSFLSLTTGELPPPDALIQTISEHLDVQEKTFKAFCENNSIEFLSLTVPLRSAISRGRQAYFTYDQHWTPVGHEIVAEVLADYLRANPR